MRISEGKKFIGISSYKIDYDRISSVLTLLKIENLSVFIDEGNSYCFYNSISVNEFIEYAIKLRESLLIFDGYIKECFINKEIEVLSNRKILIGIDLGENYMSILINKDNTDISVKDLKNSLLRVEYERFAKAPLLV